jgi:hypothetical protein
MTVLRSLSECLMSVDSIKGRRHVMDYLQSQAFPHYEPHPDKCGYLVRIEANGKRTAGRFVNCQFQPIKSVSRRNSTG